MAGEAVNQASLHSLTFISVRKETALKPPQAICLSVSCDFMMTHKTNIIALIFVLSTSLTFGQTENPLLNRDVIYLNTSEVKIGNGETCEVISEKKMFKAGEILHNYWNKNKSDIAWNKFNRQYMIYNSKKWVRLYILMALAWKNR